MDQQNQFSYSQEYSSIIIGVKFFGIYWEFWKHPKLFRISHKDYCDNIKNIYKKKFKGRECRMRLYYPNKKIIV